MILVEQGPEGRPALFQAPRAVIAARRMDSVLPALERAEAARRSGQWIAGYLSYEAGYAFEPRLQPLMPSRRPAPLLLLGVFDQPVPAEAALAALAGASAQITPPKPTISYATYEAACSEALELIRRGDCYQVNLTFPMRANLGSGDAATLFGTLRGQGVGHAALVDLGIGPALVSLSPELFFRLDANGKIEARPMKGTRPRDADPARDRELAEDLAQSPKDRAENLMIVDLLRNDIARLARIGSVKVPVLHQIEHYPTVHQMTSTITADLAAPPSLPGLMRALFPCGSVTGAPKIRAMEIIRDLEPAPRGAYCGAIGWMAPDGRADFSVAIRTLAVKGAQITLNVGGGVVEGSTPQGEWEEALWKARFVTPALSRG